MPLQTLPRAPDVDENLKLIFNVIESGKCLPFIGAGACTSFVGRDGKSVAGLPTGRSLSKKLAERCGYSNGKDDDLLKVAEYFVYSHSGSRDEMNSLIQKEIQIGCEPRPIHTVLAQLPQIKIVFTTNYDDLFEIAMRNYRPRRSIHFHDPTNLETAKFRHSYEIEDGEIILYKMHGSIEHPYSLTITESDYIHYLTYLKDKDRGIPDFFSYQIPDKTLLFLGYSLQDWNFKVLWEGIIARYDIFERLKTSYALMKNPSPSDLKYWSRKNIDIIDMDLTDFAIKLAEHRNLEIPQLGIEKKPAGGQIP